MRGLFNLRRFFVALVLFAIGIKIIWWVVAPFVPLAIAALLIITILWMLLRRFWNW